MTTDTRSPVVRRLAEYADRCFYGFALVEQHPALCGCQEDASEWGVFVAALRRSVRDGLIHQSDIRPLIRGRIEPKHIGTQYRRAKAEGLIADTGRREQSDDVVGRNSDKLDRIYEWVGGAL